MVYFFAGGFTMHAKDAAGNPIQFKFVTMLAKKPEV